MKKHALKEFKQLKEQWCSKQIIFFLDFDGTLTPIVDTPDKAYLSKDVKDLLENIAKDPRIQLVVISGRSLDDIQERIGIKGIIYVGNHGFEIKGLGMAFEGTPSAAYNNLLSHLKKEISDKLSKFPGVLIEDKGVTLSIHYRQVNQEKEIALEQELYRLTQSYIAKEEIFINLGKKVFEIKPPLHWDKGHAAMWVLERKQGFPVYIGDDTTDEDAFLVLKSLGITIHVGNQRMSYAQYYLNDTSEVVHFLKLFQEARNHEQFIKP